LLKLALNSITLTPELSYNIDIPPDSSSNIPVVSSTQ
jgi:hypothetical protein